MSVLKTVQVRSSQPPTLIGVEPGKSRISTETLARPEADYKTSVLESAKAVGGDDTLLTEGAHRALAAIRTGIQLGLYLESLYVKASNLDQLRAQGRPGHSQDEVTHKSSTASAILLFATAYYIAWDLSRYRSEDLGSIEVQDFDLKTISLTAPRATLAQFIFWMGKRLELEDARSSDLAFAKAVLLFAKRYTEDVALRAESLKYAEVFKSTSYKLTGSEFSLNGFNADFSAGELKIEFRRQELGEIVGNKDAKHFMRRQAFRLICYDVARKDNPWRKLGGIPKISMGHGKPGTGKSMLIAAFATLLSDLCEKAGIPFLFHPFPDTVVSTFQGGSAERATAWFQPINDPTKIVFAPIDDAENNLQDRSMQGVSAGVREVIGVFLRNTEGAYAIDRGNAQIHLYTNLPDQLDPAVRSRILERFAIDGATSEHDFIDQNHLWWRRYTAMDQHFINLRPPAGYTYLAAQQDLQNLGEFYKNYREAKESAVQEIVKKADNRAKRGTEDWFAALFVEAQKAYPFFTSRDVRNIQSAVSGRVMDFDLPDEWVEKPDVFFRQSFDRKEAMIMDCMKQNMKGLTFGDVWREEAVRYLDSFVRILDVGFERQVSERIQTMRVYETAEKRRSSAG